MITVIKIKSSKNQLIKEVKSLYRKKQRKKLGLFIVEGIKIIEEVIDKKYPFKNIIYTDSLLNSEDGKKIFSKVKHLDKLVHVPENIFKEISDTESPQGILGTVHTVKGNIDDVRLGKNSIFLYLDGVQDPGNVGTIIRTADAFDIDGIVLREGCVDPYNPKVVRATMGSIFRVPLYFESYSTGDIKKLKNLGIKVYSSSLSESLPIDKINFQNKSLVVIGNESSGVSEEVYKLSDSSIKIPMPGSSESLNAGVAASIIMYEAIRQLD